MQGRLVLATLKKTAGGESCESNHLFKNAKIGSSVVEIDANALFILALMRDTCEDKMRMSQSDTNKVRFP